MSQQQQHKQPLRRMNGQKQIDDNRGIFYVYIEKKTQQQQMNAIFIKQTITLALLCGYKPQIIDMIAPKYWIFDGVWVIFYIICFFFFLFVWRKNKTQKKNAVIMQSASRMKISHEWSTS